MKDDMTDQIDVEQKNEVVQKGGTGLWSLGLVVAIIFFVLKITGVVGWSWWWILSPLLFALGLSIVLPLLYLFIIGIAAVFAYVFLRRGK
jgi:polyferredoxin